MQGGACLLATHLGSLFNTREESIPPGYLQSRAPAASLEGRLWVPPQACPLAVLRAPGASSGPLGDRHKGQDWLSVRAQPGPWTAGGRPVGLRRGAGCAGTGSAGRRAGLGVRLPAGRGERVAGQAPWARGRFRAEAGGGARPAGGAAGPRGRGGSSCACAAAGDRPLA